MKMYITKNISVTLFYSVLKKQAKKKPSDPSRKLEIGHSFISYVSSDHIIMLASKLP